MQQWVRILVWRPSRPLDLLFGRCGRRSRDVKPASAPKGGSGILSFSVPNEKDDANTVQLEVDSPPSTRSRP